MQFIDGKSLAEVTTLLRKEQGSKKEDRGPWVEDRESKMENGESKVVDRELKQGTLDSTVEDRVVDNETPVDARRSSIRDPRSSIFHPRSSILYPCSSFFRTVARLGIQAAEALEHAHRLGIVHRDIKPANLILDNEGKLWVTDFGLAMVQNNGELTVTGDMLGTLRYMSPEQAAAQRGLIDQRTDIYSLGATLYELLTLQPAFAETERHQLLAQIATVDPRPPRRLDSSIPHDLETIVLKALGKSPQERYATAEQMADDLKQFLDDQPVCARRPSVRDRAIKWCRRHKALVASSILLTLVASIMAAVLFYDAYQAKAKEEKRVKEEQQRLISTLNLAKEALDELSLKPALHRLAKNPDPKVQQENRELLQKILSYYQRLADMNITMPEARFLSALAYRQVSEIFEALGDLAKGQEAYEKSIDTLEALVAKNSKNPQYHSSLAESKYALSRLQWLNGQAEPAEQTLRRQMAVLEQTLADFPNNPEFRNHLAKCRLDWSMHLLFQGNFSRAEEILLQNQQLLQDLPAGFPCQQGEFQKTLANNHMRLGWVYYEYRSSRQS